MLTAADALRLFYYDAEMGCLRWRINRGRAKAGTIAGSSNGYGYIQIDTGKKTYVAHRLIWLLFHGAFPENELDHINGDRSDNRIENLREATRVQNQANMMAWGSSGFLGVTKHHRKWRAAIGVNGQHHHLGLFETAEAAARAYSAAKTSVVGDFLPTTNRTQNQYPSTRPGSFTQARSR